MEGADGWQQQLVQLNKVYVCLTSANELERTGVGVGNSKKRSRLQHPSCSVVVLHDALRNVAHLVSLMEAENEFVRHSVKKILVAVSEHLILKAQMSPWSSLLRHIWNVVNSLKKKSGPVVCGLEALRSILKSCIKESTSYTEAFLGVLEENIHTTVKITCKPGNISCSERGLVWSALLQLLCTSIACCENESDLLVEKLGGCIPLFARVALSPHKHCSSVHCPSSFLRHKILRLMIGLSGWFEGNHSLALQCLRALRNEGADLIGFSLLEDNNTCNNLMRSPFRKEEVGKRSTTHLQCRALFLLFRIWSLELDPNQRLPSCEDRKELEDGIHHHRPLELALKEEATAGVEEWLHLQSDGVSIDKLQHLPMSLVELFSDEDDLMIEMLLLLSSLRSRLLLKERLTPLELFQALLQALSYDHTVLVDFLISQNTGALFLQYLMLCTKPEIYSKVGFARESLDCLGQLKAAVERLHGRKLFPYNPSSLLKRLSMLEELHQQV